MGFRFYRSRRILPGVRANLSKSGLSATVGIRGANVNISTKGKRYTVGLPGTGLSHITSHRHGDPCAGNGGRILRYTIIAICLLVAIATIVAVIAL